MKREEKTRLTREKIITAAIEEFGEKGYKAASINHICDSGIAKGLLYHNYENKDALYIACLKSCFQEWTDSLSAAAATAGIEDYLKARMDFLRADRWKANIILEALVHPPEQHRAEIAGIRQPYDELNLALLETVLNSHVLRKGVDQERALNYFMMMQDMFNWYCCNPRFDKQSLEQMALMHEETLPEMLDYMLYGIVKEDERSC